MNWILKTEPTAYSFDRLVEEKAATWDGVTNPVALKNIRSMQKGDRVAIYHTGDEKAVIGLAEVISAPRPDPKNAKLVVVDIKAGRRLKQPVTLAQLRAEKSLGDLALVRAPRLSVVPASDEQWKVLMHMAEG